MAASELPDVIMMDVMMPQMNGFTAASIIRQIQNLNPYRFWL